MNKIIALFLVLLFCSICFASTITRDLPTSVAPGEKFTVRIDVNLTNGDDYYLVEDVFPQNFIASNPSNEGSISPSGKAMWVVISNATSAILTYDLIAPQEKKSYDFNGVYYFGKGSSTTNGITPGDISLVVKEIEIPYCGNNVCDSNESCSNCSNDCGACTIAPPTQFCGDKKCDSNESCSNCPTDCNACGVSKCSTSNCLAEDECQVAVCEGDSCKKSNKADDTTCSIGSCLNGFCTKKVSSKGFTCTNELEGMCVLVGDNQVKCINGQIVEGCTDKSKSILALFEDPFIQGVLVFIFVLMIFLLLFGTRRKKKEDSVIVKKDYYAEYRNLEKEREMKLAEIDKQKKIQQIKDQLKQQLKK
jgi:hypothetical protein